MPIPTPFGSYPAGRRDQPEPRDTPRRRHLILVADPDARTREQTARVLNRLGYATLDAAAATAADDLLRVHAFDLVIAALPAGDAASLHWIIRLLNTATAPVIVLGTAGAPALQSAAPGLAGFLPSPPNYAELGRLVAQLLR